MSTSYNQRSESETFGDREIETKTGHTCYQRLDVGSDRVPRCQDRPHCGSSTGICALVCLLAVSNVALFLWTLHLQNELDHIAAVLRKAELAPQQVGYCSLTCVNF